jgi:hypothetical protein
MFFYFLKDFKNKGKILETIIVFVISLGVLIVTLFVFGAFYSRASGFTGGLGNYSANLNSLFNPGGTSRFLQDLPLATDYQHEGYGYLGLGMLLLLCFLAAVQLKLNKDPVKITPLAGIMLSFFFLALSPRITLNEHVLFSYYIPVINEAWGIFRSTGRFMWPLIYIIICIVLWGIKKEYGKKTGAILLCACLFFQYLDLNDYFTNKGRRIKDKEKWQTELISEEWNSLASQKSHIMFMQGLPKLYSFLDLSIRYKLTTNDSYLARKNIFEIQNFRDEEKKRILNGAADDTVFYVFETDDEAKKYANHLRLSVIDGVIVGISR